MRQYLDRNDTIGEIRQARRHPAGRNYIWVLVEGLSDQKLYAKLIDGQNTKVEIVNGGGKNEIREALLVLIQETDNVIGIRDADFLHLEQNQETIDVLFLTDAHDSELMLIASDVAFQQIIAEYLPAQRTTYKQFRLNLLESLIFFSGLRWINDTDDLGLNFKGIGLAKFYDVNNVSIDKAKCVHEVSSRSPHKKRLPDIAEIDAKVFGVNDLYNLCNGHDSLKALALLFTAKADKGNSDVELSNAFRVAFRKEDFALTMLFNSLKQWEVSTGYSLFSV